MTERLRQKRENPYIKVLLPVMFLFFILFFAYQSVKSLKITRDKLNVYDQAEKEVAELRLENLELILKNEWVTTGGYIEEVARDDYNYAKEGEKLFTIPESLMNDPDLDEYLGSIDRVYQGEVNFDPSIDAMEEWFFFFIDGV